MARPANVEDIRNYHKDLDAITKKYGDIQLPGVVTRGLPKQVGLFQNDKVVP